VFLTFQSNRDLKFVTTNTSYVVTGLEPYTKYEYTIIAVNQAGDSKETPKIAILTHEECMYMILTQNTLQSYNNFAKLWRDIENLSCFHTQKCLLNMPTFVTVLTVRHLLPLMYYKTVMKEVSSSRWFWVWEFGQIFNIFPLFGDFFL